MANTASNANRVIATKGTSHVAKTQGPTDVCHLPILIPAPFPNSVPTTRLGAGQTVRTKIADQPIWIAKSVVGPPSDAAHPSHAMGVASGQPHQNIAQATSWSGDVLAEGLGVVRTNDTTKQDAANTVGVFSGAALGKSGTTMAEFAKNKCTVTKLEGVQTVMVDTPGAGALGSNKKVATARNLGWKGRDRSAPAAYLEILTGSSVDFTATRYDLTTTPRTKNPTCGKNGSHTTWYVSRKGGGAPDIAGKKCRASGDTYTLDSSVTSLSWLMEDFLSGDKNNLMSVGGLKTAGARGATDDAAGEWNKQTLSSSKTSSTKVEQYGKPKNKNGTVPKGTTFHDTETTKEAALDGTISSFAAVVQYFKYWYDPCVIGVAARSCAGDKVARLKLYPSNKVDFSLSLSTTTETAKTKAGTYGSQSHLRKRTAQNPVITKIRTAMSKSQQLAHMANKISRLGGIRLSYKFMKGAKFGVQCEYVPCTETKTSRMYGLKTPAHVGFKWNAYAQAETLLAFGLHDIPIPLLKIAGYFFGPAGAAITKCLNALRIKLTLEFSCGVDSKLGVKVGLDEYGFFTETGGYVEVNPWMQLMLTLEAGYKWVSFGMKFTGSLRLDVSGSQKKNVIMERKFSAGIKTTLILTCLKDSRWFEKTWEWEPDALGWKFEESPKPMIMAQ